MGSIKQMPNSILVFIEKHWKKGEFNKIINNNNYIIIILILDNESDPKKFLHLAFLLKIA